MIRKEFTGMLPGAIEKFEELLAVPALAKLNPVVVSGYNAAAGKDSFFSWGVACRITCDDMKALKTGAASLKITWLSKDGDMAWINGLTIDDFKSYRVNGALELMPEKEV